MVGRHSPIFAQRDLMLWLTARGPSAHGDRVRPWLPQARVPLADKPAPIFDGELLGMFADMEDGLLVAVIRRGDDVYLVEVTLREFDGLALGHNGIRKAGAGGSKPEIDAIDRELSGQHLGRQRVTVGVESALRPGIVIAGSGEVILQRDDLRSNALLMRRSSAHAQREGTRLIGLERGL